MRQVLSRRKGRIGLGIAALVVVMLVALGTAAIYVIDPFGSKTLAGGPVTAPTLAPTKDGTIFMIDASSSEASFTMHEVLFGQPQAVVGTTSHVAGQILVDQKDPSQSKIGEIKVDLSTLVTDSDLRNQTIQNRILETGQPGNQYATFVETALTGLPASISIDQPVSFSITGNLTIHGVTKSVTFTTQVTLKSATELTGQAQATIHYADFNIAIPNVPQVTDVSDTTALAVTFTARA